MKVEQLYTQCLAQGAYYIESNGEMAIIDPLRETEPYLKLAKEHNATIKYIFETHFHADFVSGHIDLAAKTGATIVYGPNAHTGYDALIAADGEEFHIGNLKITLLHTPGHTMESSCYLLHDEEGKPTALFSGDTLFIGDVGRPDLAQKGADLTMNDLAGFLFDSLRTKVMTLPDDITVFPAHGAGSSCGKSLSNETHDTLGNQKRSNYALRADMTREEFIHEVTDGILPPPVYFAQAAKINRLGYENVDGVLSKGLTPLSADDFEAAAKDALILDTRDPQTFAKGFVPGALNIGLDGTFALWVGAVIPDIKQKIVLITQPGREEEAVLRCARVGYDGCLGYLDGGFESWVKSGKTIDHIESIPATEFAEKLEENAPMVVDVRKPGEFSSAHLPQAKSLPLDFMLNHLNDLPKDQPILLHCAGGYRSMIATSMLRRNGYRNIVDVAGGFAAIRKTGLEIQETACSKS